MRAAGAEMGKVSRLSVEVGKKQGEQVWRLERVAEAEAEALQTKVAIVVAIT